MSSLLRYIPIFRGRQEEIKVLKSFDFGEKIYPCVEIIKELDRLPPKPRTGSKKNTFKVAKRKLFEEVYLPLINSIKAKRVFVDLPVHLSPIKGMQAETVIFLTTVVSKRDQRTNYMKKLTPLAEKVIPVISTYSQVSGELGSITKQANDLRTDFKDLAFRTFAKTFAQDILQIEALIRQNDYVIMDWEETELDLINDFDQQDIVEALKRLDCNIIVHRNPFPKEITLSKLEHEKIVDGIDNSLLKKYKEFSGNCFSDYAGIKKDNKIGTGGVISPGFIYYDAVENNFYGFRYKNGSHSPGETPPNLSEFETTIVPAVISSNSSKRMQKHSLNYLGLDNVGWRTLQNINNGGESGRQAAKFKKIGMEHYAHCLKTRISNGDFD
jgi:hypothetical protein